MVEISNDGIVTMNYGDTFEYPLFINCGTRLKPVRFYLATNDILYFRILKPHQKFKDAIIKQEYTVEDLNSEGDVLIRIDSKYTMQLKPGEYYMEGKLVSTKDGQQYVNTIIPARKFILVR